MLFALVCINEDNFQIQSPGANIRRGFIILEEVFLRFRFERLLYGGTYFGILIVILLKGMG